VTFRAIKYDAVFGQHGLTHKLLGLLTHGLEKAGLIVKCNGVPNVDMWIACSGLLRHVYSNVIFI